ncbi:MAG: hypothetical protein KC440_08720, partial [Nitrosarchaeum sp.]|nr:hypothetical protein [Nitrosarchaeum sp.]
MVRTFSYGFLSIILAIYLKQIVYDILIGVILSVTLLNSVFFTASMRTIKPAISILPQMVTSLL